MKDLKTSLKNYSSLVSNVYLYLGYKKNDIKDDDISSLIDKALNEIDEIKQFKYIYKKFDYIIDELNKEPYISFLAGSSSYAICAMTLGYLVESKIKMYSKMDLEYMVIFDAAASAYLEFLSDEYEKSIFDTPSYRFCPGYGGSKASDIFLLKDILKPESIGIDILDSNTLVPQKSMIGIVSNNNSKKKSCNGCILSKYCKYKERGILCYK